MDIRIGLTNGQIVLIENKVDAPEGGNQIGGYLKWLKRQNAPDGFPHQLVFLTPDGRQPVSTTRPEAVVCLCYSRVAKWVADSRKRIEAPRLGVILDHYVDVCRLIGETMRRETMGDAFRQFFLDPDEPGRFEAALELAPHVESYRRELYVSLCDNMAAELTRRLQTQGYHEQWLVAPQDDVYDGSPLKRWKGWRIAWRARQGRPHFAVKVEYWPREGLFYGVTRGFDLNKVDSQHPRDEDLQKKLCALGFTGNTGHWPGYRYFGDLGLPRLDPSRTDDVLEIHRELQNPDGLNDLVGRMVDLVWELFNVIHPDLEKLNDPWLYPDVR